MAFKWKIAVLILTLLMTGRVFAQATSVINGQVVNPQGKPIPFAAVRICPQTATGVPCSPIATIYSDPALSNPLTNPTSADQYGFFSVFVNGTSSFYQVQTSPSNTVTYNYYQNGVTGGSGTITSGANYALPVYPLNAAQQVGPSNVTLDSTGNSLNIPATVTSNSVVANTSATSANKVLYVVAPPYNAKCDGTTDDQTAIQTAFNDAQTNGYTVQFPAGTCLTSTITWKGQPFFGAGVTVSKVKGKPGQDVFATPDGNTWTPPANGTLVHDIQIQVDNTIDASASSHGNNTFPNRIAGTLGGTTNLVTPTISPGPVAFGTYTGVTPNYNTQCSGTISAGTLNQITFSGANCLAANSGAGLNHLDSWRVIGAPITVKGANTGGTDLVTTISAVSSNGLTLTMAASAVAAGTYSGTFLNPVNDGPDSSHWYLTIGNCGFAFPNSNGASGSATPNIAFFTFQNVSIVATGGPWQGNHSCGVFMQAAPYHDTWYKATIQGFYGGYIEALPATNPNGTTWTGDTTSFNNMDFTFNLIPLIIEGGNHRTLTGVNFYGGVQYETMGPLWINSGSSATIDRIYFECDSKNTGEQTRISGGSTGTGFQIVGGTLGQCGNAGYIQWQANNSHVNTQLQPLHIGTGAYKNTFTNTALTAATLISDLGASNYVQTQSGPNPVNGPTQSVFNHPRVPSGMLNGAHLLSGNSTTPYLNDSDLITTCWDMGVMFNQPTYGSCVNDPTGTEITLSYFLSAGATTTLDGFNNGGSTNIWSSSVQRQFGISIPQTKVNVVITAMCVGCTTFTGTLVVKDGTANSTIATSPTLTFGTNWVRQVFKNVDLSSTTYGNALDYRFQVVANDGTAYRISSIKIEPINADEHTWLSDNGLPTAGGNIPVANTAAQRLCTGASSGFTAGHMITATGVNSACDLQDGGAPPAALVTSVPAWLQSYGDGSEGALNVTTGSTGIQTGDHYYTTCNVSAGATLFATTSTLPAGAPLFIHCTGAATIAGTISYSINTGPSNGTTTAANYGAGSGGGGFGVSSGTAGNGYLGTTGAGTAGTSGVAGGAGTATPAYVQKIFLDYGFAYNSATACGGSVGGAGNGGVAAGRGAGCIIIVAPSFSFTGTCDVTGQNGTAGGSNTGGGGGGGGGICLFRSPSFTTNTGTFSLTGGTGGAIGTGTSTAGGNGANGWSKVYTQ